MRDPTKRYVTVVQVLEMLHVSERTVRRWMSSDPPLLHSIEDSSGHRYIDMADVERIKAEKPELVNEIPARVEILEDQAKEALALKPVVQTLKCEVEELKQQVNDLLALVESGGIAPPGAPFVRRVRPPVSRQSGAEARGYPAGTIRLIEFTDKHQLSISGIKELHWKGDIAVTIYEREHAKRNGREWWITPEQHRAVVAYYQQQQLPVRTETCDTCSIVPLALSS